MEILVIAVIVSIAAIITGTIIKRKHTDKQIIREHTAINNTIADLIEKKAIVLGEEEQTLLKDLNYQPETHLEHLILLYTCRKTQSITFRNFYKEMSVGYTYNLRSQVSNMTEHNKDYKYLDFQTNPSQRIEQTINPEIKSILPFLIIGNMEGTSADKGNEQWKDLRDSSGGNYNRSGGSFNSGSENLLETLFSFGPFDR